MQVVARDAALLGSGGIGLQKGASAFSRHSSPKIRNPRAKANSTLQSCSLKSPRDMTSAWLGNPQGHWKSSVLDLNPSPVCDSHQSWPALLRRSNWQHQCRRRSSPIRATAYPNSDSDSSPNGASPPIGAASKSNPNSEASLQEAVLQLKTEQQNLRLVSEQPSTRPAWEVGVISAKSGPTDGITLIRRTVRGGQTEDHPGTVVVRKCSVFNLVLIGYEVR